MGIQSAFLGVGLSSSITAPSVAVGGVDTGPVSVEIVYSTDGKLRSTFNGNTTIEGDWVTPNSANAEWEIRATLVSGDTPSSGSLNTWQALSSVRGWSLIRSTVGVSQSNLTFDFRRVGGSSPEVTVTGNIMTAEVLDLF